jgi:hypothetical protein
VRSGRLESAAPRPPHPTAPSPPRAGIPDGDAIPRAYPRACPLCAADYRKPEVPDLEHVTLAAEDGGTPSPWRPDRPGRTLTLRCTPCGGSYPWDYFADALPALLERARVASGRSA